MKQYLHIHQVYLHEHLRKTQFHDQFRAYSQDHTSTEGSEQAHQEYCLSRSDQIQRLVRLPFFNIVYQKMREKALLVPYGKHNH